MEVYSDRQLAKDQAARLRQGFLHMPKQTHSLPSSKRTSITQSPSLRGPY